MNNIKFIHHYNYEDDPTYVNLITLTIEIIPEKAITTYEYTTPNSYPNIEKKVIEEDSKVYESIKEIDISNLATNTKMDDLPEYWELEMNGRKLIGSYMNASNEIIKILSLINFDQKRKFSIGE